ncbi:hypothetical protein BDZ97DRAFT_738781 [Flammula alnicola]|nr:hypothetical protein BDZ97DRAFT_738781 [Flammula alnicola]
MSRRRLDRKGNHHGSIRSHCWCGCTVSLPHLPTIQWDIHCCRQTTDDYWLQLCLSLGVRSTAAFLAFTPMYSGDSHSLHFFLHSLKFLTKIYRLTEDRSWNALRPRIDTVRAPSFTIPPSTVSAGQMSSNLPDSIILSVDLPFLTSSIIIVTGISQVSITTSSTSASPSATQNDGSSRPLGSSKSAAGNFFPSPSGNDFSSSTIGALPTTRTSADDVTLTAYSSGVAKAWLPPEALPTSLTTVPLPTSTDDPSTGADSPSSTPRESRSRRLSPGVIAAIVIIFLLSLLALLVYLQHRKRRWYRGQWASRCWPLPLKKRTSQHDEDGLGASLRCVSDNGFPTTFHHHGSDSPLFNDESNVPPLSPTTAGFTRENGSVRTPLMDAMHFRRSDHLIPVDSRLSVVTSTFGDSRDLLADQREGLLDDNNMPMSIRLFSSSETFAFPKPPSRLQDSVSLRPSSYSGPHTPVRTTVVIPPIPPVPKSPPPIPPGVHTNPFGDGNPFDDPV